MFFLDFYLAQKCLLHLAATALISAGGADLAYVVEGHASACPQTVDVGKCV